MFGWFKKRKPATEPPAAAARSATRAAAIVGTWKSVGGDYPLTNEYRADGTLVQHVGGRQTAPSPFRIEGDRLIVSVSQPDGTVFEQEDRFAVTGQTLTFFDPEGSTRTFRRT